MRRLESSDGIQIIIGADDVGTGAIAGPLAIGVCVVEAFAHQKLLEYGVKDSKKLSESKRKNIYYRLTQEELPFHFGYHIQYRAASTIDQIGIKQASFDCIEQAIAGYLSLYGEQLTTVYLDRGLKPKYFKNLAIPSHLTIIEAPRDGESLYPVVAAASILAKTERDTFMAALGNQYPHYGFETNAGYGGKKHQDAIRKYGPLQEIHRFSFLK